ncbi:MAG: putative toxin-antitoxin system toxin component, PIN family [Planctomycetaceae bacterium]
MTSDLRVVIDTGVVVSAALLPRSVPRRAVDRAVARGRVLLSADTMAEIAEVLRRPKFDKYVSEEVRLEFLAALIGEAEIVEVAAAVEECRDPKDDKLLELAVSGVATHVVSGDADLLVLHPFRGIPILVPQDFLDATTVANGDG